jgi:hypothetical protein
MSALQQPVEQSRHLISGHYSDDIDVGVSRKRGRRVSASSVATLQSIKSLDSSTEDLRLPTSTDTDRQKRTNSKSSLKARTAAARSQRRRADSATSSKSSLSPSAKRSSLAGGTVYESGILLDLFGAAEATFEYAVRSQLVETFLSIFIGSNDEDGKQAVAGTSNENKFQSTRSSCPDYLSPLHPPSSNPSFAIDASTDFPPWANLSGHTFHLEVWAKVHRKEGAMALMSSKGKKKEHVSNTRDWKILEEYDVDLNDLRPIPDNVGTSHASLSIPV